MTLVTGATGCLGSNLTKALLQRGERVAILRRERDELKALGTAGREVEHRLGDLRDPESVDRAIQGIDRIYHVAGITEPLNRAEALMRSVNVEGTENVARSALRRGVQRLVYTSSVAAIGFPDDGEIADETFAFNGNTFPHAYSATKRAAEAVVARYVKQGLDAVIVNPAATIAPGGSLRHGWAALVMRIRQGKSPFCFPGGLGMLSSRDMTNGHIQAMEKGQRGERYILNSVNLTYRELFEKIASVVDRKAPQLVCPKRVLHAMGRINTWLEWLGVDPGALSYLVSENVPMLIRKLYYSPQKAVRELGLILNGLEDSIQETYQWCLEAAEADLRSSR
jgi:nucleoside-diphosphate-sugar epimerase